MDAIERGPLSLQRVGEPADGGLVSDVGSHREAGSRLEHRPSSPRVTPPAPPPPPVQREGGEAARLPIVLMASLGAHALFAFLLTALPAAASLGTQAPMIEIEMALAPPTPAPEVLPEPPAPEPEPEPEVVPEPVPVATPRPRAEAPQEPRPAAEPPPAPEPPPAAAEPPPATAAPPSLDEVFGEPPPPLPSLTGGEGGFAVAPGSPNGAAGGVPGGRGRGVSASAVSGTGQGTGAGGPSADEVRRARRAYAERIRELLGRAARYPVPARRGGMEGRVVVALRIASDGRLLAARVTSSCGYAMLDEAALAAANDLRQVPAPPSLVAWDSGDELRVPIVFELTR